MKDLALAMEAILPKHEGGLTLEHNPHKGVYESVASYQPDIIDWVSAEEMQQAIAMDTMWKLQWYPDTPVGFNIIAASSLEAILLWLMENTK